MANLTKDNPARMERDVTIANNRLAGMTYNELAKQHNLSKAHISRILNDDEIKDVLQTGTKQLVSMVPRAIQNYHDFLTSDNEKIKLEASRDIQKTTGIMPTHTVNQFFTSIMNQHNQVLITDDMQEFMRWKLEKASRTFNIPGQGSEVDPHE